MSALGHKQSFSILPPQCLLPGVKQPFILDWNGEKNRSHVECLLSPKADIQISENEVKRRAAFGHKQTTDRGTTKLVAIDFHDLAKTR